MINQFEDIYFLREDGVHYGKVAYIENTTRLVGDGSKTTIKVIKVWREDSPLVEALDAEDEGVVWFHDERSARNEWAKILKGKRETDEKISIKT